MLRFESKISENEKRAEFGYKNIISFENYFRTLQNRSKQFQISQASIIGFFLIGLFVGIENGVSLHKAIKWKLLTSVWCGLIRSNNKDWSAYNHCVVWLHPIQLFYMLHDATNTLAAVLRKNLSNWNISMLMLCVILESFIIDKCLDTKYRNNAAGTATQFLLFSILHYYVFVLSL